MNDDTLSTIGDRPALRFERRLGHDVERVWRAVSEPAEYRFELSAHEGGCLLVFTHVFDERSLSAQTAAGWHAYLSRLEPHLDGGSLSEAQAHEGWAETHEVYAERFGVDPGPGRRFAAGLQTGG